MTKKATSSLVNDLRSELNKAAKENIAYDLHGDNPTDVKTWISTGSTLLDYIVSNRRNGGIPVGKLTTIAGESASGKSLVVTQILANTQKMGGLAVYIDTENAASPDFMEQLGLDTKNNFMYVQPGTIEEVFETIERLICLIREKAPDRLVCIAWDSVAGTPVRAEVEGDYDPNSRIGLTAKALAKGMRKVTETLGKAQIALVFTNQLKTNIGVMFGDNRVEPGGKALPYHASTRIWMTQHKGKANGEIRNEKKQVIGFRTSAKTIKSRFGPSPRTCEFDILFDLANDRVGIRDESSWLQAIAGTPACLRSGSWYTIEVKGEEKKFQSKEFEMLLEDKPFRKRVLDILEEECRIGKKQ
jgi:recombination protein RecA|tara:strand:- start:961 stop:2034 length:1074 start_codon:yes stop_codon:yes gene_type:complete